MTRVLLSSRKNTDRIIWITCSTQSLNRACVTQSLTLWFSQLGRASSFRTSTSPTVTATPVGGNALLSFQSSSKNPAAHWPPKFCAHFTLRVSHIAPTYSPSETRHLSSSSAHRLKPPQLQLPRSQRRSPVFHPKAGGRVPRRDRLVMQLGLYAANRSTAALIHPPHPVCVADHANYAHSSLIRPPPCVVQRAQHGAGWKKKPWEG